MRLGFLPCYVGSSIFPFDVLFDSSLRIDRPHQVEDVDAILLWGGEDIASKYYGEDPHPQNQNRSGQPSKRDKHEWEAMRQAWAWGVPIIGVCRGAQFMTAFAGGKLIQHMHGHHGDHDVTTYDGKVYQTSSCHHQAMLPEGTEHEVLAKAGDINEVVYYPAISGFAIQGHPEWMNKTDPFVQWCFKEMQTRLFAKETV